MKLFGITGWKNSGKTGLMERLVADVTARGFRVATIKHAHHSFDVDQPGKDSHRHREAGAAEVLLSSTHRWALMAELRGAEEPDLAAHLARLSPADLVLVEGYKRDRHPKIECVRKAENHPLIAPDDPTVKAVASDGAVTGVSVPVFDLNDTGALADFILAEVGLIQNDRATAPLPNDCFALPPGVDWTPVDVALDHLRRNMVCVTGMETVVVADTAGRILARDVIAARANPPGANSAVDGYGFAHASVVAPCSVPLVGGRAAAGAPFTGAVPAGQAVRVLTGALLPVGVDTVVLQEDVTIEVGTVVITGSVKPNANTRKAGEDVAKGAVALTSATRMGAAEIALATALGVCRVSVRKRLRIGVLSTGDEIADPGRATDAAVTYDANRPMLLSMIARWGFEAVDLGHALDKRDALAGALDAGVQNVDMILTSGGASAGDEDHLSALLSEAGAMQMWRIAVKPGRPLALGLWGGVPVFGLPGNPVAAFVTALIFARPAAGVLAGAGWHAPQGFTVPAAFEKSKKAGRREYLRARINAAGQAEVFASEGSGRISGLTWADGLVELEDGARAIKPGDPVTYYPYGSFGL